MILPSEEVSATNRPKSRPGLTLTRMPLGEPVHLWDCVSNTTILIFLRLCEYIRDCFAGNENPPSEVLVGTGVELGVGLSMALVTFVFNLHSNATWSLHSLWQFIPQSEKNVQRFRTGS